MGGRAAPTTRPAFSVSGAEYDWDDVIAAARHRGDWRGVEQEAQEGLACLRLGEQAGTQPSADQVRAAAAAFRRQRGLLAAEEMEAWLGRWSLSQGDWMGYIRRSLARAAVLGAPEPPTLAPVADADVDALVWPTAVCSGALETFADRLAARLAVGDAQPHGARATPAELEAAYDQFCRDASSIEHMQAQISLMQLEWTRVDYRSLGFDRRAQAQEALLMVTDDGVDLDGVAAAANATVEHTRTYLADVDDDLRYLLLGAAPGDTVLADCAGRWCVMVIEDKVSPSLDDPELARRAAEAAVTTAVQREVDDRVRML